MEKKKKKKNLIQSPPSKERKHPPKKKTKQKKKMSSADEKQGTVPAASPNKGLIIALVVFILISVFLVLGFVFRERINKKVQGVQEKAMSKFNAITGADQYRALTESQKQEIENLRQVAENLRQVAAARDDVARGLTPEGQAAARAARVADAERLEAIARAQRAAVVSQGRADVSAGLSQARSSVGTALSNLPGAGAVRGIRSWWGGESTPAPRPPPADFQIQQQAPAPGGESAPRAPAPLQQQAPAAPLQQQAPAVRDIRSWWGGEGTPARRLLLAPALDAQQGLTDWWARNTSTSAADAAVGFPYDEFIDELHI